ncbi:MAG: bifunctional lysylphosphatidylglycerol flippase/synthetase MprF [Ferrimicrobium sp.]
MEPQLVELLPGGRAIIFANLLLSPNREGAKLDTLLEALIDLTESDIIVIAGNLFDRQDAFDYAATAATNRALFDTLASCACPIFIVPGALDTTILGDASVASNLKSQLNATVTPSLDIACHSTPRFTRVRIEAGSLDETSATWRRLLSSDILPRMAATNMAFGDAEDLDPTEELSAYLVARSFYRRIRTLMLWALAPLIVITALKAPILLSLPLLHQLRDHVSPIPTRLELVIGTALLDLVLVLLVSLATSRTTLRMVEAPLHSIFERPDPNGDDRLLLDRLDPSLYTALVTGAGSSPELTPIGPRAYANPGGCRRSLRGVPLRLPLPRLYRAYDQVGWVTVESAPSIRIELTRYEHPLKHRWWLRPLSNSRSTQDHQPVLARFPSGPSFPNPSTRTPNATVRARRLSFVMVIVVGIVQLLSALLPPLSHRVTVLPNVSTSLERYADAFAAATGVALLGIAQGLRMGQRRSMHLAIGVASIAIVSNLTRESALAPAAILVVAVSYLLINHRAFGQRGSTSRRISLITRVGILAVGLALTVTLVALGYHRLFHASRNLPTLQAFKEIVSAIMGIPTAVPSPFSFQYASDALGLSGATILLFLVWALVAPYQVRVREQLLDRTRNESSAALLARYGDGTLDYFALRDDKTRWVRYSTMIAYGEFGNSIIVSPDPIGPPASSRQAFNHFYREMIRRGMAVGILGASPEWLDTYRALNMRAYYIGDEAVVTLGSLTLEGKRHKSLRQAVNRMATYGYRVTIERALALLEEDRNQILRIMAESRRGDRERGFSMTLGRIFDQRDNDLILSVCRDPKGVVVGFCQWVPAPAVKGYSLDIMRRDRGNHPNGMFDFLIVETMRQLAPVGVEHLSLNFATMRAVLAGEHSSGIPTRVERWVLGRLSDSMQIESLWRFNAKFDPEWQPRYLVVDSVESLPAIGIAAARAESLWDIPLIGRLFNDRGTSHE